MKKIIISLIVLFLSCTGIFIAMILFQDKNDLYFNYDYSINTSLTGEYTNSLGTLSNDLNRQDKEKNIFNEQKKPFRNRFMEFVNSIRIMIWNSFGNNSEEYNDHYYQLPTIEKKMDFPVESISKSNQTGKVSPQTESINLSASPHSYQYFPMVSLNREEKKPAANNHALQLEIMSQSKKTKSNQEVNQNVQVTGLLAISQSNLNNLLRNFPENDKYKDMLTAPDNFVPMTPQQLPITDGLAILLVLSLGFILLKMRNRIS